MKTKKGNLATNQQANPSTQKTSKNQSKKRGKRGFSLVELVTIVAMMAVLMAILVPSLLPYVERTRAQRDDLAMNEVTNAVLLAMTDPDAYDELAEASLPENVSCYIDTQYESEHSELIMQQSVRTGAYHQYIFDDQARLLDATKYFAAGNMHGVTITFKPIKNMNKTKYILADGVINQFVSNGHKTVSDYPYLYAYMRQTVGEELEVVSRMYKNSEYTIFVKINPPDAGGILVQDTSIAYGQFSGTNLSKSDLKYYVAYGRTVGTPEVGTETGYLLDDPSDPGEPTPGTDTPIGIDAPVISVGQSQVFDKANPSNLTFTSTAPFNEFQAVKVDGATVDSNNYSVSEGSTIVVLFSSYISTLSNGTHTLAIVSNGGIAGTTFTVMNSNDVVVVCGHDSTKVIGSRDATCVMRGFTGDTYCADCNVLITNGDYIEPTGHEAGDPIKENNVEPTCFSKGSYSMATYCKDCGTELSRENFIVLETTHQGATRNENIVDATCSTIGSYEVVTYCRFCNVEMNREYRTMQTTPHIEATRTENTIASTCYSDGSYDLVTYCSVCNSELNRVNKSIQKANHTNATKTENEVDATCSANGSYETVVYCSVCGYEISRTTQSTPKVAHTQATRRENEVAPTCSTEGSYDNVTYCSVCGHEIGRAKEVVAMLDHTPATKTDRVIEKTCTTDGHYDTVTYCSVCNTELDRTTTTVAKTGHVTTTATENNILPTCSREGSYDTVTYCSVCNAELDRVTESVAKLAHITATRKENEIVATCSAVGTYDTVTYCTVCNEEIDRKGQTTPKLDHTTATKTENNVAATCSKEGSYETVTYCKVCSVEISRVKNSVAKLAHTQATKTEVNVAPTCTKDGSNYLITYCAVCKVEISKTTQVVAKTGHVNTVTKNATEIYSGDIYCTTCNTLVAAGTYGVQKRSSLNDYSWVEIQYLAQNNEPLANYNIKIGDTKTDGGYTYVLVDDARNSAYDGLVFMFNSGEKAGIFSTQTNTGGFAASTMRDYLNNTSRADSIINKLPSSLTTVIKNVDVKCNDGNNNYKVTHTANVKLFLISLREAGVATTGYSTQEKYEEYLDAEGSVFDWFNSSLGFDVQQNRNSIGKGDTTMIHWWTRSANAALSGEFWLLSNETHAYSGAGSKFQIVPVFVIG